MHKCPAQESNSKKCCRKGHSARACGQRMNNIRTVRKLTENEATNQPNESKSESDESINHFEETKTIENKQKQYTAVMRINNGIKKEFVIDTWSPVTIIPPDERILEKTETHEITTGNKV